MTRNPYAVALSIAGSDPSGGAGIQADIKTFTVLGVYGGAAITCLTSQNTRGIRSFQPIAASYVTEQVKTVLTDLPVSHIKIGMVGNAEIARALSLILADFNGEIIFDPVLAATGGEPLSENNLISALHDDLLKRITVITPNIIELEKLTSHPCPDKNQVRQAMDLLMDRYPNIRAVITKGGHLKENEDTIIDMLVLKNNHAQDRNEFIASHPRTKGIEFHGTGCTFASAFTAFHMHTGDYQQAFFKTVDFMDRLIAQSTEMKIGQTMQPLATHLLKG
ncbi:MAG: bifunctional hydroxymethylpyrimidine kinase/phosphomethylpyrimidine kinase [Proteobacteria bacterium]|nr:bifunctional hydroxymethylpyrimidine kinase/phosphomethylpyrimidine kinase [Pseudomonadota bacterium]MBU1709664.1 bifunctional hydroxymethylpyrimidine kinase/phosphomethylpyrimidine kinase [Pseudomonadota bacterium]